MESVVLFSFAEYWSFYALFVLFVLLLLAIDLGVFHRDAHEVSFKESFCWSVVWVALALLFNFLLYRYTFWKFGQDQQLLSQLGVGAEALARQVGLEFLTGFIVEKSLAIDNIFVFVVVFNYFAIPLKYQHRVLFFGIIGALLFRVLFIALGAVLLQYKWIVIFFGLFLVLTGLKIIFAPEKPIDPEKNPIIRLFKKLFRVTPEIEGQHLFVKKSGLWYATPLMVALVFIEVSDIIFAVDSVPAIFAITKEPFIVFTSNVFAILGLRAMYFMLAGSIHKFRYLKYGLGVVLVFVGLKMAWLNDLFGGKFPITWSLIFIFAAIALSILVSFVKKEEKTG
ncbi:MAG: TerC/Alx family metal homeostasis membrane protein [Verrucomicrobia bacterium]|nr:TerC/Alx family metal homeostasis membrane protein [Verrucomicrobiota bacterium]MBS0638031.1 TerC/Alx family metal homeostasis membrane protein [Verrucomicrobiota bacterium]